MNVIECIWYSIISKLIINRGFEHCSCGYGIKLGCRQTHTHTLTYVVILRYINLGILWFIPPVAVQLGPVPLPYHSDLQTSHFILDGPHPQKIHQGFLIWGWPAMILNGARRSAESMASLWPGPRSKRSGVRGFLCQTGPDGCCCEMEEM